MRSAVVWFRSDGQVLLGWCHVGLVGRVCMVAFEGYRFLRVKLWLDILIGRLSGLQFQRTLWVSRTSVAL